MREIFLIIPLLFKSEFRKKPGEKRSPVMANLILGALLLVYSIIGGIQMIPTFDALSKTGLLAGFVCVIFLLSTLVSTLFSLAPMLSLLYFSKDGEFYLHLPLKSSSVYMAKMIYLYVSQLYISALICAPMLIILGITQNLSFAFYALILIGVLTIPFLGLLLSSVLALPIIALSKFFKNRGAVSSIALILTFALVIGGYMALTLSGGSLSSAQTAEIMTPLINTVTNFAIPFTAIANASMLLPQTAFGLYSVEVAFLINIAVVIVFFALVVFLSLLVGKAFYNKGVSALLENRKSTQKGDNVLKKNKQFSTLLALEAKTVMRNSSLAFNVVGSFILCPVMAVALAIGMDGDFLGYIAFGMVYAIVVGMGVSMNTCACIAFSKDGENFYAIKYLPINKNKVIGAKLVFPWLLSSTFTIVSIIIALIIMKQDWYHYFAIIPIPLLSLGMSAMDMLWDLRRPNLSWHSVSELAKSTSNVLVPTFIGLGLMGVLLVAIVSFLVIFFELGYLFAYVFVFLVGITLSAIFVPLLFKKGEKMIEKVE
ncbi:MAG: hypothetical protein E7353_08470 [Clostridiales bacterium]|nr:hypothetical protein [Clostridiales bacterium]